MDTLLTNIGQLVTPIRQPLRRVDGGAALRVIRNTTLAIHNGRIQGIGVERGSGDVTVIDARGGVVMPGLIDPVWVLTESPDWERQDESAQAPDELYLSWNQRLLERGMRMGVTTLELKCPVSRSHDRLSALSHLGRRLRPRTIGAVLASIHGDGRTSEENLSSLVSEVIPGVRQRKISTFLDLLWTARAGFAAEARTVLRAARGAGLRTQVSLHDGGAEDEFLNMVGEMEIASISCASFLSPRAVTVLIENDITPVYLPNVMEGSSVCGIDVRALVDSGVPLAIGSGFGLNGSTTSSMWMAMGSAMARMGLSLDDVIEASTLNNAYALDISEDAGSLEPGKWADLMVLDLEDYREMGHCLGVLAPTIVMINGNLVSSS